MGGGRYGALRKTFCVGVPAHGAARQAHRSADGPQLFAGLEAPPDLFVAGQPPRAPLGRRGPFGPGARVRLRPSAFWKSTVLSPKQQIECEGDRQDRRQEISGEISVQKPICLSFIGLYRYYRGLRPGALILRMPTRFVRTSSYEYNRLYSFQ